MSNGFYKSYLQSNHWHEFRKHVLETKGRKCEDCGATEGVIFDIHHLTYENLGEEQLEDVVVLCHSCHMARHPDKFHRRCKHEALSEAYGGMGSGCLSFYWYCNNCKMLVGNREPNEKEKLLAIKEMERHKKWKEKEKIKQAEKEAKKAAREALKPPKPKLKKKKKRKPYKKRTPKVVNDNV
jgi:hypothetical protein